MGDLIDGDWASTGYLSEDGIPTTDDGDNEYAWGGFGSKTTTLTFEIRNPNENLYARILGTCWPFLALLEDWLADCAETARAHNAVVLSWKAATDA